MYVTEMYIMNYSMISIMYTSLLKSRTSPSALLAPIAVMVGPSDHMGLSLKLLNSS